MLGNSLRLKYVSKQLNKKRAKGLFFNLSFLGDFFLYFLRWGSQLDMETGILGRKKPCLSGESWEQKNCSIGGVDGI